jgi:hypothetical protein
LDSNLSSEQERGPKRGLVEEDSWRPSCDAIEPDVRFMDRILEGSLWYLTHAPAAGEWIGMRGEFPYYAYVTTPQASAPDRLIIFYWDDGARLHLDWLRRGDDGEPEPQAV